MSFLQRRYMAFRNHAPCKKTCIFIFCLFLYSRHLCPSALRELKELHFTFLAQSYNKEVLDLWKREDPVSCYDLITSRLGYRFTLKHVSLDYRFTLKHVSLDYRFTLEHVSLCYRFTLKHVSFGYWTFNCLSNVSAIRFHQWLHSWNYVHYITTVDIISTV